MGEGRSLAETPTWSVATVTTVMVAVCFIVERSIHRLGKWLKKTKRKPMLAALVKIREELMILGLISLMLSQTARWISEICVPSSLFTSRFYICSEGDYSEDVSASGEAGYSNRTDPKRSLLGVADRSCSEGHESFVPFEGLEQLHRFLFILGITHVLYSFVTVVLSMIKIYSWRTWENQANPLADDNSQDREMISGSSYNSYTVTLDETMTFVLRQRLQLTGCPKKKQIDEEAVDLCFPLHISSVEQEQNSYLDALFYTSIQGIYSKVRLHGIAVGLHHYNMESANFQSPDFLFEKHKLPHSYDFHKYMVRSMEDEFHGSVGISWPLWVYAILCIFINIHGLNIYFWLSFVPAILVMVVGTKLQHVVVQLALEVVEATDSSVGEQLKPRDDLFWFRKPEILVWLIQFISFQNAFEMATFIWSLQSFLFHEEQSNGRYPPNFRMGSKFKKSLIAESVRESLHSWCRRVKQRSKRDSMFPRHGATRSTCSLDDMDETTTVVSGTTLSRSPSFEDFPAAYPDVHTVDNYPRFWSDDN